MTTNTTITKIFDYDQNGSSEWTKNLLFQPSSSSSFLLSTTKTNSIFTMKNLVHHYWSILVLIFVLLLLIRIYHTIRVRLFKWIVNVFTVFCCCRLPTSIEDTIICYQCNQSVHKKCLCQNFINNYSKNQYHHQFYH